MFALMGFPHHSETTMLSLFSLDGPHAPPRPDLRIQCTALIHAGSFIDPVHTANGNELNELLPR